MKRSAVVHVKNHDASLKKNEAKTNGATANEISRWRGRPTGRAVLVTMCPILTIRRGHGRMTGVLCSSGKVVDVDGSHLRGHRRAMVVTVKVKSMVWRRNRRSGRSAHRAITRLVRIATTRTVRKNHVVEKKIWTGIRPSLGVMTVCLPVVRAAKEAAMVADVRTARPTKQK